MLYAHILFCWITLRATSMGVKLQTVARNLNMFETLTYKNVCISKIMRNSIHTYICFVMVSANPFSKTLTLRTSATWNTQPKH